MPQTPSTRWCPTPEQLMILEEMYRSGVRTPNAAEIQQITAHLAYYGRIEGKNVFYWFQNHKARERQRLRRRLCARHQQQTQPAAVAPPPGPGPSPAGGSSAAGVHPAVMQLHHHHPYATCSFMPHHPHHLGGYLGHQQQQQQAATLPAVPAAAGAGGKAMLSNHQQPEWETMEHCNAATASGGSSDELPPCCRRPLKTLDLFPTRSTGLKDECSSSKSSSCSTSTN
ncbi:hypothetical protein SEVIR_8G020500v4 [Setaria viridis]|nr:WUSCHEL-related homeobox 3A-like [Setaria viridis]